MFISLPFCELSLVYAMDRGVVRTLRDSPIWAIIIA